MSFAAAENPRQFTITYTLPSDVCRAFVEQVKAEPFNKVSINGVASIPSELSQDTLNNSCSKTSPATIVFTLS